VYYFALLLLHVYGLSICLEIGKNLSRYKVTFSINMTRFYFPQWRFLICQWYTCCYDAISINRSINLIINYFNNQLIDSSRLIVAVLAVTVWILEITQECANLNQTTTCIHAKITSGSQIVGLPNLMNIFLKPGPGKLLQVEDFPYAGFDLELWPWPLKT